MITKWKREDTRTVLEMVDIDRLVPKSSPLRKIDAAVDWDTVYAEAEPFYATRTGRPSVDPAVLVRLVLLCRYTGAKTLRSTLRAAGDSVSRRWFLGYCLSERLPSLSAVGDAFRKRFDEKTLERIFSGVIRSLWDARAMSRSALCMPEREKLRGVNRENKVTEACNAAARRLVRGVLREFTRKKAKENEER